MQTIELTADDLLGYAVEDIKCRQCTRFCACHVNRMLDGQALFLCGRKDEVRQIIAAKEAQAKLG